MKMAAGLVTAVRPAFFRLVIYRGPLPVGVSYHTHHPDPCSRRTDGQEGTPGPGGPVARRAPREGDTAGGPLHSGNL